MTTFNRYLHGDDSKHPAEDEYLASKELAAAVNASLAIGRPLLVAGEPGTGKTTLADSIRRQLGLLPVLRFDTHSDGRWQDCLYSFDALARLYDAQAAKAAVDVDPKKYRRLNALGRAVTGRSEDGELEFGGQIPQRVVLIDEIDKAPRDFPNGLLTAIDGDLHFEIPETREKFQFNGDLTNRPIVIFTTNEERSLPDAFLRRCVFFHIEAPDQARLQKIVLQRLAREGLGDASEALVKHAVARFADLRERIGPQLEKKPATAELIDWVQVLIRAGVSEAQLGESLPFAAALLKTKPDTDLQQQQTMLNPSRSG